MRINYTTQTLCLRFFIISILFNSLFFNLIAQEKPNLLGNDEYERLKKTKKEYEEALASGDSLEVAEMCYRMGKRYQALGDFYTGEKWFMRSLRIREPLGPSEDIGKVYIFLTSHLIRQKQYDEAIKLAQKAIVNFKAVNSDRGVLSAYMTIVEIYRNKAVIQAKFQKKSVDSALNYLNKAQKLAPFSWNKQYDLVQIAYQRGYFLCYTDTTEAIVQIKKAYAMFIKINDIHGRVSTSFKLANIFISSHQLVEGEKWLKNAKFLLDSAKFNTYDTTTEFLGLSIELNKQKQNYKEALKYQQQLQELTVNGISTDRDGAVSRLKIEYDTQKKETELKEQEKFTKIAIAIGAFALLTSVVFFWFFRKYRILSKQNAALVSEQNHRVKNNLQQVTNLLSLQSTRLHDETAKRAVNDALLRIETVSMVHHRLYDGERLIEIDLSTFIPELTEGILRSYNYHDLSVNYKIDNLWLHVEQALPLGLIINELVTNACKYAFPENPKPLLFIYCYEKEGQVTLKFSDNGPGFDHSDKKKTFGLKLIQIFTERLKGKSGFENRSSTFYLTFQKQGIKAKKNPAISKLSTT